MQATVEFDPSYSLLTIDLTAGESIKAEPGAMVAQQGVAMTTGMSGSGGLLRRHPPDDGRRVVLRQHVHRRFRWWLG